jgi:hypothetical protein
MPDKPLKIRRFTQTTFVVHLSDGSKYNYLIGDMTKLIVWGNAEVTIEENDNHNSHIYPFILRRPSLPQESVAVRQKRTKL